MVFFVSNMVYYSNNFKTWGMKKENLYGFRVLQEEKTLSEAWNENLMITDASKSFGKFKKIESVLLHKIHTKKIYEFYFICKFMAVKLEENLIDLEIEFEDRYPDFNFNFMVIRRENKNLSKLVRELTKNKKLIYL